MAFECPDADDWKEEDTSDACFGGYTVPFALESAFSPVLLS